MKDETRGQSGLDRLMLFVLAIVVVVMVLPFVLGLGGVDVREPANGTGADPADGPTDLVVLNASGETDGFGDDTVGVVRVVVTKNGSGDTIDAATLSASWANGGSYTLASTDRAANGSDGAFGVSVDGPSEGGTKLQDFGDRATLTFDLGDDDVDGVPEFGRELREGETVTLTLTTTAGKTTTVVMTVPEGLNDRSDVVLGRDG